MKPDLDLIYTELDLRPNCSLEEFQHAYRRRIAELHPDRPGDGPSSPEDLSVLRDLIWMYAMVTRFHRRYGRMPGGSPPYMRSGELPIFSGQSHAEGTAGRPDSRDTRRARATMTLVALFIALLVLLASWGWLTGGTSSGA